MKVLERANLILAQVVLYFLAMFCTPIFINTFVVFVRLYWFEKRFQNVVSARYLRGTKSRTRTEPREDPHSGTAEKGVRGRSIVVLHNGDVHTRNTGEEIQTEKPDPANDTSDESRSESNASHKEEIGTIGKAATLPSQQLPSFRREITFADEVKIANVDDSGPPMLPQRLSPEEHINFLENQRNPKDKGALRIPGPQDFDRGRVPEPTTDHNEEGDLVSQQVSSPIERKDMFHGDTVKRNVTIDEPDHPRLRLHTGTFSKLSKRKSDTLEDVNGDSKDDMNLHPNRFRAGTGTFSSMRRSATKENEPPTPYLSWQPTIGRNSAFVDLTEEQREELGGIEYRSLKTLAVVLVCKSDEGRTPTLRIG